MRQYKRVTQSAFTIGLVGHVDHGKTTLVRALSGKWADTHSEEIKRGITIRLGYADVAFFECGSCKGLERYGVTEKCQCGKKAKLVRRASLIDAPGHESLMATMLSGANLMDCALLLVSAAESCPQPQTQEHVKALEIMGQKNIIVVQNKIDMVDEKSAEQHYKSILEFLKKTPYKDAPVIPVSALHNINIDALVAEIMRFPLPKHDATKQPLMYVARSFDVNKPGTKPKDLQGGVLGGVLKQGTLHVGDEIEIFPGYDVQEKNTKVWNPLTSVITQIIANKKPVKQVIPGGSFSLLTKLDPNIVKSDRLAGSVVGLKGKLPPLWEEATLKTHLIERIVGAKDELVVEPLKVEELLMLNVNASATVGIIQKVKKGEARVSLRRPVCAEKGSRVAMSRNIGRRWRLIGWATLE